MCAPKPVPITPTGARLPVGAGPSCRARLSREAKELRAGGHRAAEPEAWLVFTAGGRQSPGAGEGAVRGQQPEEAEGPPERAAGGRVAAASEQESFMKRP